VAWFPAPYFNLIGYFSCSHCAAFTGRARKNSRGDNPATFIAVCAALHEWAGQYNFTDWETRDDATENET
jgi:hypothetical protein